MTEEPCDSQLDLRQELEVGSTFVIPPVRQDRGLQESLVESGPGQAAREAVEAGLGQRRPPGLGRLSAKRDLRCMTAVGSPILCPRLLAGP